MTKSKALEKVVKKKGVWECVGPNFELGRHKEDCRDPHGRHTPGRPLLTLRAPKSDLFHLLSNR